MDLHDDCLTVIFHALGSRSTDQESFALTCRKWLYIRDFSFQSLQIAGSSFDSADLNKIQLPSLSYLNALQMIQQPFCSTIKALHIGHCTTVTDECVNVSSPLPPDANY
ncbi:hypothetical protein PIB30_028505 [Stylosanthes scabra]|uniref:Uncharacterized protein n=1 Tax=Stylosanthes scabra TaxID=79078 RepID=A0ABU6QBH9_9FABA|nr:hypothetical protein [Stylosanthes scabra]